LEYYERVHYGPIFDDLDVIEENIYLDNSESFKDNNNQERILS